MFKYKNLLFLVSITFTFIAYGAQEAIGLDEEEKDFSPISSSSNKTFNFISSNGAKFKVPLKIALQIPLIKAQINFQQTQINLQSLDDSVDYSYNFEKNEISEVTLGLLIYALKSIDKLKNLENKRVLYEKIQTQDDLSLKKAFECFAASVYLDFEPLANVYADQIAQHLFNEDRTLNKNNLINVINLFVMNSSLSDSWYLIEKFYYLRSNELKPKLDTLLLNDSPELINYLNINPANVNFERENIIKKMKLSINDLVDYEKNLPNDTWLRLTNFYLASINGLKRIVNINDCVILDLSKNQITNLGNNLEGLHSISRLVLSKNQITNLGTSLQGLIALKQIFLSDNQIFNLGVSFQGLESLKYLNLSSNQIRDLGDSLRELNAFVHLNLSNNQIRDLGDSLQGLNALQELDLSNNQIINLGDSLRGLNSLRELNFDNNRIINLGHSLQGFNALEVLVISNNQLTNLANSLHGLNALKSLSLSNNQIVDLGASIQELNALWELDLANNQLTDLGNSLQGLNVLKELNLKNNPLVSLGNNPERILNLRVLKVEINQLNPESLALLANWQAIHGGQND
ncbi:MAG: hypothetical protein P4L22_00080 [Candidatus Babeliales bacterium]|nr:hypothetical protein [Candidatus Babeliales bacterium]